MKVLAFDTCFGACSAALIDASGLTPETLASQHNLMQRGHAEALLPMIETVLRDAGETCAGLDKIAVTHGPGTFTGVRVGIAAARAMALATGCPLVGINTFEAIANDVAASPGNTLPDGPFAVVIDARRGQVYIQTFKAARGNVTTLMDTPMVCDVETASNFVSNDTTTVIGSGGPLIVSDGSPRVIATDIQPDAIAVARLAASRQPDARPVSPLYLRPPDAKPQDGFALERTP